jgi:hypothetical protein
MRIVLLTVVLVFLGLPVNESRAGGPWNNQYCNVKTVTVVVKDKDGKTVSEHTEEKVECNDGVRDFLHESGIAGDCRFFTWLMPLGGRPVEQRGIACPRLDGGGYEIVSGYHSNK